MAASVDGMLSWGATRDEEGNREYKVKWLVKSLTTDGPVAVFNASGLCSIGSYWNLGGTDPWAWCKPTMAINIHQPREGDPNEYWTAEQTFSSKINSKRCQDTPITDPLLEPYKISGSFVTGRREAITDKDGTVLVTSAREKINGSGVEFDVDNPSVHIEMNTATLGLSTFSQMVNTVNSSALWGLPSRCIKLANVAWERKVNASCCFYYTRSFDFQIDWSTLDKNGNRIGFDVEVFDYGNRCLKGEWRDTDGDGIKDGFCLTGDVQSTSSSNIMTTSEKDFCVYKEPLGEIMPVCLDGHGRPALVPLYSQPGGTGTYVSLGTAGAQASGIIKYYRESNFLSLGIPASF